MKSTINPHIMNANSFRPSVPHAEPSRQRRLTFGRKTFWILGLGALLLVAGTAWIAAQPRRAGTFGPSAATPAYIVVNTPTLVTFTSQISDPKLKTRSVILIRLDAAGEPSQILGRLTDDGKGGDAIPRDGAFTVQTTLNEPTIGPANFKIAARFKPGKWSEPEPDDDDWDRELSELAADRVTKTKKDKLSKLLRKLGRYALSEVVRVTVDPFPLPPDPGEAGKQTLEGIDSDSDGVRDDLQRYIALTFVNLDLIRFGGQLV